jgi:phage virion morphogenesis protein
MADNVRIELDDRPLQQAVRVLADRMANMRGVWGGVGRYLRSRVQLTFRAQQSPYGEAWQPTLRGGQILRLTGRLRDSVDFEAGDDHVAIGTNVRYARVHQFGATIHAKNVGTPPYLHFKIVDRWVKRRSVEIPARPFLPTAGLPEDWTTGAVRVISGAFTRSVGAS